MVTGLQETKLITTTKNEEIGRTGSSGFGGSLEPSSVIALSPNERGIIWGLIENLDLPSGGIVDDCPLLTEAAAIAGELPTRLRRVLVDFRKRSNDHGGLAVFNLPVQEDLPVTPTEDLPVTPTDGGAPTEFSAESTCLLLLMSVLGDPIGYADEKNGALVHNIFPVRGEENRQENTGSVFFDLHTENAFHPFKPDFLGLICLRPDHDSAAETVLASVRQALPLLSDSTGSVLREPLFHTQLASSFTRDSGKTFFARPTPVLSGDGAEPEICVDFHNTEPLTERAADAMRDLREALQNVAVGVSLNPGDALIVDNRASVHGRTNFQPRYDGRDRWLQRMFVVADIRKSRMSRPADSHVCVPWAKP